MKKFLLIFILFFSNIYAANISSEEQNTNTNSIIINKNLEKGRSKSITKQKSISIGKDITKNKSSSISSNIQVNKTNQKSITISNTMSVKKSISIPATQLMPEVDFLLNKILTKISRDDKTFIPYLTNEARSLFYKNARGIKSMQEYIQKIQDSLRQTEVYQLDAVGVFFDRYFKGINFKYSKSDYCDFRYFGGSLIGGTMKIQYSGDINGYVGYDDTSTVITNIYLTILNKAKLLYDVNSATLIMSYLNNKVIVLSPNQLIHFYGDLLFNRDNNTNDFLVVDRKINADGLILSQENNHQKFDDYFKKLMYLYFQAFKHLKNEKYSIPEIKFLVRKYIYEATTGKKDFLYQYLSNPTDFWRPNKQILLKYPIIKTAYNDVIYSKKDGIILNNKIVLSVETMSSIDYRYSQLFSNSKTRQFAQVISRAINFYKRQNKQFAANLVKSLAVKFAQSNNFNTKKDLIIKANTSTDVLKNLLSIVK